MPLTAPLHIDPNCRCGTALVLDDYWEFSNEYHGEENEPCEDEWICPRCRDAGYRDWPKEQIEELRELVRDVEVGNTEGCREYADVWEAM